MKSVIQTLKKFSNPHKARLFICQKWPRNTTNVANMHNVANILNNAKLKDDWFDNKMSKLTLKYNNRIKFLEDSRRIKDLSDNLWNTIDRRDYRDDFINRYLNYMRYSLISKIHDGEFDKLIENISNPSDIPSLEIRFCHGGDEDIIKEINKKLYDVESHFYDFSDMWSDRLLSGFLCSPAGRIRYEDWFYIKVRLDPGKYLSKVSKEDLTLIAKDLKDS